ncbi:hypothetical protein MAR_022903 [Mya arenaria]|uniref:Uncharacterized protein n=1 Tax=Mya arenaria TaxID=6604 RepID=A0ABY7DQA0_MYAAR|nr:hypothetical protein MAR_022903 [Mya arenaria]
MKQDKYPLLNTTLQSVRLLVVLVIDVDTVATVKTAKSENAHLLAAFRDGGAPPVIYHVYTASLDSIVRELAIAMLVVNVIVITVLARLKNVNQDGEHSRVISVSALDFL